MAMLLLDGGERYVRFPKAGLPHRQPCVPPPLDFPETMGTFAVEGGHQLKGRIRPAGNKNAALPCLAATLLAQESVTLRNVPRILDVLTFLDILSSLGSDVSWIGANELIVDTSGVEAGVVEQRLAARIRASLLLAGPLLARFG